MNEDIGIAFSLGLMVGVALSLFISFIVDMINSA